ncbi:hypothetical protein D3C71_1657460 [compost metagenome]
MIDLRNLIFSIVNSYKNTRIDASLNGEPIGSLIFTANADHIKLVYIDVNRKYQNLGVGQSLYREFGKIYNEQYNGMNVEQWFVNPIAEYAFRKAVSLGWIPQEALTEHNMKRSYDDGKLVNDLRNKLPENVRGPEVWANKYHKEEEEDIDVK